LIGLAMLIQKGGLLSQTVEAGEFIFFGFLVPAFPRRKEDTQDREKK
jgi:hypothetical protein